ncbi:MAG: nucleoside triphosphate pyrophosphohydrolase, partial [Acidimicrobiaceae bacterium]|nr:nucleoside triphosphate pyrophosphohydrolase [Acidimicrobiaceae bacterium]
ASQLTVQAAAAINEIPVRFLRTRRHPSAAVVDGEGGAISFDDVYDRAESIDEVYATIVERLVAAAEEHQTILYAVPGSPLVAEHTVELLRARQDLDVEIQPSLSFLDLAWARLGVDPVAAGVRVVDGHRFAVEAAGTTGPLLVAQVDSAIALSDIKLAVDDGPEVTVLQRLGLPDESVRTVSWADLDREVEADHLTCVWIPGLADPVASELVRLDELVHTLRARCPWDAEQTHASLTRHLLEETYEVLEAIEELSPTAENPDAYQHLEEELGDLLFQVYFHATLAAEAGAFSLADVARGIHDKLVARHPHVFAGAPRGDWEQMKKQEKGRGSVMDGIPGHLPSLAYAEKVQRKAASLGFDWPDVSGAWQKVPEELGELADAAAAAPAPPPEGGAPEVIDELGDLLFSVVNVARHLRVDSESALRAATRKFRDRFVAVEALVAERYPEGGEGLGLEAWDRLWEEVKARNGSPS